MLDNALARRLGRRSARAPGRRRELIALDAAPRQGGERQRAAAARARALLPAAERGLRAAAGRDARRCTPRSTQRRRPRPRARGCCARTASRSRRRGASRRRHGARRRAVPARAADRAERGRRRSREVDWAQSAALLVRRDGRRAGRLAGPGVLRLLRRGRLLQAPARRRLGDAVRAAGAGDPPRAAVDGQRAERRIVELSRNRDRYMRKHHSRAAARGRALADRVDLRAARARRARAAAATTRSATGGTSRRRCTPSAARGCARRPRPTTPRSLTRASARSP